METPNFEDQESVEFSPAIYHLRDKYGAEWDMIIDNVNGVLRVRDSVLSLQEYCALYHFTCEPNPQKISDPE